LLVESVQDYAIFTLDPLGRVTSWNAGAERIKGYRADEIIGHSFARFYPPDNPQGVTPEAALQIAATEGRFQDEGLRLRKDGSQFWADVVITALRDPQGSLVGFSKITRDITERKRADEEMRKLHSLVENSEDFIGVASLEGEVLFVNAAGRSAVGLSGSDPGRRAKILDYVAEEDLERFKRDALPAVFRDGRWKGETLFRNLNTGASIPMWQDIFFVTEAGSHRRLALAMISRDITERKRVEASLQSARAQLAHMSRLTTMGELTASIAHEVNQPLAAVVANGSACLRWLAQEPPNLERARDSADRIVKEGNRAGQVVQRVRTLSKRKDPQRTVLDLNDIIQETLGLIEAELSGNHISVSADLAPDLPSVFADRVQLQQVILNLAMNGIESMRTVNVRPRELAVGSRVADDNRVAVTIRDNGTGFSSGETEQFFEPFFTTKPQGTGMGLSICRNIVEAHGGDIRACANADHGATLEFLLPLAAKAVA
jgi:PAS domain S-box-containing protein